MGRQQGSGERNHRYPQEKQKIEKEQPVVRAPDVIKQTMMVHPHNSNKSEAEQEGSISWPLRGQGLS